MREAPPAMHPMQDAADGRDDSQVSPPASMTPTAVGFRLDTFAA
jgi:hypothetical protein